MDLSVILVSVVEFLKLLILVSVVSFIGYKLFSPLREKLAEKYSLSWLKSCLALNFILIFVITLLAYIYFMYAGAALTQLVVEETQFDLGDNIIFVVLALPRILISTLVLSLALLFFEFIGVFFMEDRKASSSRKSKKPVNNWLKQAIGVVVASMVFLLLVLFVFNWVSLGLFVYIFYGALKPFLALIFF